MNEIKFKKMNIRETYECHICSPSEEASHRTLELLQELLVRKHNLKNSKEFSTPLSEFNKHAESRNGFLLLFLLTEDQHLDVLNLL